MVIITYQDDGFEEDPRPRKRARMGMPFNPTTTMQPSDDVPSSSNPYTPSRKRCRQMHSQPLNATPGQKRRPPPPSSTDSHHWGEQRNGVAGNAAAAANHHDVHAHPLSSARKRMRVARDDNSNSGDMRMNDIDMSEIAGNNDRDENPTPQMSATQRRLFRNKLAKNVKTRSTSSYTSAATSAAMPTDSYRQTRSQTQAHAHAQTQARAQAQAQEQTSSAREQFAQSGFCQRNINDHCYRADNQSRNVGRNPNSSSSSSSSSSYPHCHRYDDRTFHHAGDEHSQRGGVDAHYHNTYSQSHSHNSASTAPSVNANNTHPPQSYHTHTASSSSHERPHTHHAQRPRCRVPTADDFDDSDSSPPPPPVPRTTEGEVIDVSTGLFNEKPEGSEQEEAAPGPDGNPVVKHWFVAPDRLLLNIIYGPNRKVACFVDVPPM